MKATWVTACRAVLLVCCCGAVLAAAVSLASSAESQREAAPTPKQVFEDRILPIFRSPNPSSCTQCHLSNIDIKDYILPSHEKTFLSLRDHGLIDVDKPLESKILKLIRRGEQDNPGAALIHAKVRQKEYEAFAAWIEASCADPKLRAAPKLEAADLVVEEATEFVQAKADPLLASFQKNIWVEKGRCDSCHQPGGKENAKFVAKFGQRVSWMKREGPEATMKYLLSTKMIDTKNPEKSAFLLKPLNEIEHGGGKKIMRGDKCFNAILAWLTDVANSTKKAAADPPRPDLLSLRSLNLRLAAISE